jgi:hypothetical protein
MEVRVYQTWMIFGSTILKQEAGKKFLSINKNHIHVLEGFTPLP